MGALLLALCGDSLHSVFVFHPVAALRGRKPPREAVVNNQKEENPMKKTRTVRTFLAGVLAALLVVGMIPSALAAAGKTITVYPGINIYIDDQKLEPKDANGKPVEVFTYNGTTYLPVRAIAEALGKNVQWDGRTQSVYLGQHGTTQPTTWLNQEEYFNATSPWQFNQVKKDNLGNEHERCMKISSGYEGTVSYVLNGQYRRLTGVCFLDYEYRNTTSTMAFEIYGDGQLLKRIEIGPNVFPVDLDLDVTGIQVLQFNAAHVLEGGTRPTLIGWMGELGLWA